MLHLIQFIVEYTCERHGFYMKNNITLIGMPGVGKSTVGVILAKILGYQFIDSDLLIQESTQKLLIDIIHDEGIDGFIAIENDINASIDTERSVISTGGSVVYCEEAMKHLKDIGTVIYLNLDYEMLKNRLGNMQFRGVVMREGYDLKKLYEERVPLYQKYADLTIDTNGLNVETTIQKIQEAIARNL